MNNNNDDKEKVGLENRVGALTAENERLREAVAWERGLKDAFQPYQARAVVAESRLATAVGLIDAYMADDDYDAQGCINRVRAALTSAQVAPNSRGGRLPSDVRDVVLSDGTWIRTPEEERTLTPPPCGAPGGAHDVYTELSQNTKIDKNES